MNIKQFFPSKWLTADDLGSRRVEVTISHCTVEEVHDPRSNAKVKKLAISFEKATKMLIPNKTQAFAIAELVGDYDTDNWSGARIALRVGQARNKKPTIVVEPASVQAPAPQLNGHEEPDGADA